MRQIYTGYKNSYIGLGYTEEEASVMAGRTISVHMITNGLTSSVSLSALNKVFGNSKLSGVGNEGKQQAGKIPESTNNNVTAGEGTAGKISSENQKYIDILSPEAKKHILYGDSLTSGRHLYPGNPGKTIFPKDWSANKVVHEIGDIATSPNTQWYAQTGTGGIYTAKGKPANWVSYEVRDGVRIRVVYQPATGKIITAFPDNAPVPNSYKPIK